MFKKILIGLIVIIAGIVGYAAMQPPLFELSREVSINAPADKVFPYVNNRKLANSWNPWLLQNPQAKLELSGPEEGVGSKTSWSGGKKLGTGSATVTESVANELVKVHLDYQKPFVMQQDAFFLLKADGQQTVVTWKISGNSNLVCRIMGIFMNMDKMVGDTFTKGLNDLKALVEKPA